SSRSLRQREYHQRRSRAKTLLREQTCGRAPDDGLLESGRHRDILLSVNRIRNRRAPMPGARLEIPQLISAAGIQREEISFGIAGEYQVARRGQHGRKQYELVGHAPDALTSDWIPGVHMAIGRSIRRQACGKLAIHRKAA